MVNSERVREEIAEEVDGQRGEVGNETRRGQIAGISRR